MRNQPIDKAVALATIAGLIVIFGMRELGFNDWIVGLAGFGVAIAAFFLGGWAFKV